MRYFRYSKRRSNNLARRVWEELSDLKSYAMTIYKGNWEDAMYDSYIHILNNYDENKGSELHNYVIKILKTIYKSYGREISDEDTLNNETTKEAVRSFEESNDYTKVDSYIEPDFNNVDKCVRYLLPRYIEDFKFFEDLNTKEKTFDYNDLSEMFSEKVIVEAISRLRSMCNVPLKELQSISKKYKHVFRRYTPDRYKEDFDEYVEFECQIGDVILYKNSSNRKRFIYKVNIRKLLNRFMVMFESDLSRNISDLTVWCTLSGLITCDINAIKVMFEQEIVGKLLISNSHLKILAYDKGNMLYLTSVRDKIPEYVYLNIFDKRFGVKLESVVAKEV